MDRTRYVEELAATVDRSGWALQAVNGDLDPSVSFRLGAVTERWASHYGVMAHEFALRDGTYVDDVRFLQVVVPDPDGHLWDHPDYDRLFMDLQQPHLSDDDHAWRSPFAAPTRDLFDPHPDTVAVSLPVLEPRDGDLGRRELVPAVPLGDEVFRLIVPPVLADWVTADAEVYAPRPELVDVVVPRMTQVYERVVRQSPLVHLVWLMHIHDLPGYLELMDRVEPELELPDTAWVETGQSLHVATPQRFAARVGSRLRHLVRDGLLLEREPYHRAVAPELSCGPWCAAWDDPRA